MIQLNFRPGFRIDAGVSPNFRRHIGVEQESQTVRNFRPAKKIPLARNLIVARHGRKLCLAAYAKNGLLIKRFLLSLRLSQVEDA
jgi:hypothetical protein